MEIAECETRVCQHFARNGFRISEAINIHPALELRPPIRIKRKIRGVLSDAVVILRKDPSSYENNDWRHLIDIRRRFPNLAIYFVIPDNLGQEPLKTELQELGIGLYIINALGGLTKVQADRIPFDDTIISFPIEPNLPFRNKINLHKVFDYCTGHLYWLDKHFVSEGFGLIHDWCQPGFDENDKQVCKEINISEIRILGSNIINSKEMERIKRDFFPFREELGYFGITVQLKIISDARTLKELHDRYIISENIAFNVLPVRSITIGQKGSLKVEENPPDFGSLWGLGNPIQ